MGHFEYAEVEVDDIPFVLTIGYGLNGGSTVYAVTDKENDIHYVSEEFDYFSDDLMPTATVPDGYGVSSEIVEAKPRVFESVERSLDSTEELESTLSQLANSVLGTDSQREDPRGPSSRKAEEIARRRGWQGVDPDEVNEERYPVT